MKIAYTRAVSPALPACALTHLARTPIDLPRAVAQHAAYEVALVRAGCTLRRLQALPDAPDGVFVEDTAILLGAHAIITRPGAASRAAETASVAAALTPDFTVHALDRGTLDGGDVLRIGATLYVGLSSRTDKTAAAALAALVAPLGYTVVTVPVLGCLHLKTAATWLGGDLLMNNSWIDTAPFAALPCLHVALGEPWGANSVRVGDTVLLAAGSPQTAAAIRARGYHIEVLDIGELQKAEAGLSCLSLIAERASSSFL